MWDEPWGAWCQRLIVFFTYWAPGIRSRGFSQLIETLALALIIALALKGILVGEFFCKLDTINTNQSGNI